MAQYLAADARRLKIGYSFNGGSGSYVSAQATRAASSRCSPGQFDALEHAILSFSDDLEARRPQSRGWRQLELLLALDGSRLSAAGNARLRELQRKFPAARIEPPRALEVTAIGSPISENAQAKMSDEHWLRAMRKYARVEDTINGKGRPSGGELQLARDLESRTKEDPIRFATLATRMENELPATYFDAIIRGIAERLGSQNGPATSSLTAEQAAS